MPSAALKTLLLCDWAGETRPADDDDLELAHQRLVETLARRFEGRPAEGQEQEDRFLLFDRPLHALEFALVYLREAAELTTRGNAHGVRVAVHLGEVFVPDETTGETVETQAAAITRDLLDLAGEEQILVTGLVERMARYGTRSGDPIRWRWRHHGQFFFRDEEEAVEVYEVGAEDADFRDLEDTRVAYRVRAGESPAEDALQAGQSLGPYRILDLIGRGGMGVVYLAEDTQLGRRVALKTLSGAVAENPEYLARFEREVRAVAAVNHPNIVTVHSVEKADGVRFLTMEHVEGRKLSELVPAGGLPPERVIDLALPMADALAAAHSRGIVHRDLKPANVMVTDDGRPKVLDFGLAKSLDPDDESGDSLTQAGQLVGTLKYMAPEQLRGDAPEPSSDLYSLGVMLYEMILGHRPFRKDGTALVLAILNEKPDLAPLAERDASLAELVGRCLAGDPDDRLSAVDLRDRLRELQWRQRTGEMPVPANPRRSGRLGTVVAGIAIAAGLALVAALMLTRGFGRVDEAGRVEPGEISRAGASEPIEIALPRPAHQRVVVLPFEDVGEAADAYFSTGLSAEITHRLAAVEDLGVISPRSARRYGGEHDLATIGEELDVDYVLSGAVLWTSSAEAGEARVRVAPELTRVAGGELAWGTSFDLRPDDLVGVQAEIAEKVVETLGLALAEDARERMEARPTASYPAYQAYLRGLHRAALPDYQSENRRQVVDDFTRATQLDPDFVQAWAELSKAHSLLYHLRHDRTPERRSAAREAVDRALALDASSTSTHLALGLYHYYCERDYERALEELHWVAERAPSDAEAWTFQAWVLRRVGRADEAWQRVERALELNPRDPSLLTNAGHTALWRQEPAEAERLLAQAIALAPGLDWPYWLAAWAEWMRGDVAAARAHLDAAPVADPRIHWYFIRQAFYENRPDLVRERLDAYETGWISLIDFMGPVSLPEAWSRRLEGDDRAARALFTDARDQLRGRIAETPWDPRLHSALGLALAALGESQEAVEMGKKAVELQGHDEFEGMGYLEHLAQIYAESGRADDAVALLDRLLDGPSWITAPLLRFDPRWAPLVDLPAFQELLERHSEDDSGDPESPGEERNRP